MDGTENEDKVELTAGLANRRWLIIKCMGDDVNGQSFIWVGGDDVESVSNVTECIGMTAWPRYELVLTATADLPIFAVKKFGGSDVDVRIMEIG